jgi:hypothetical protein
MMTLNVEWDGKSQLSYEKFYIIEYYNIIKEFKTGNPIIDWIDFFEYISEKDITVSISFDCDLFLTSDDKIWYSVSNNEGEFFDNNLIYHHRFLINDKIKNINGLINYYNNYYRKLKINKILNLE